MGFCSRLIWAAGFAAAVSYAADSSAQPKRIESVVRADLRTGKLVRSVIVTPKPVMEQRVESVVVQPRTVAPVEPSSEPAPRPADSSVDAAVERIAAEQSLSPELLHSVIKVESNYNPYAVSSKGALGMMQLIPSTARRFGVGDVFNPVDNIQGGAKYLKYLLELYGNNTELALAAYNAGEGAVAKHGGVPPYRETQNYVHLVAGQLKKNRAVAKPAPPAKEKTAEANPGEPNHITRIVEPDGKVRYVTVEVKP
jgi:soluble lytic murein transglycosylase-like protein